jgi:hypothetical protein
MISTNSSNTTKRPYVFPRVDAVALDKDISLTMTSIEPPFGPTESSLLMDDFQLQPMDPLM